MAIAIMRVGDGKRVRATCSVCAARGRRGAAAEFTEGEPGIRAWEVRHGKHRRVTHGKR